MGVHALVSLRDEHLRRRGEFLALAGDLVEQLREAVLQRVGLYLLAVLLEFVDLDAYVRHERPQHPEAPLDGVAALLEEVEEFAGAVDLLVLDCALQRQHNDVALGAAQTLEGDGRVVALGGGTPTAPGAADLLRTARDARRAIIVYLTAEADTLRTRLAAGDMADRPSLTGADPRAEIEAVLARRDPLYRDLATEVIETDSMGVEEVAGALARLAIDAEGQ